MAKPLVIVESPAKAKTLSRFLGGKYRVEASIGHVRDLPERASEVPAEIKDKPWGRMPPLERPPRGKADRKTALSARALEDLAGFLADAAGTRAISAAIG